MMYKRQTGVCDVEGHGHILENLDFAGFVLEN